MSRHYITDMQKKQVLTASGYFYVQADRILSDSRYGNQAG